MAGHLFTINNGLSRQPTNLTFPTNEATTAKGWLSASLVPVIVRLERASVQSSSPAKNAMSANHAAIVQSGVESDHIGGVPLLLRRDICTDENRSSVDV